ncbi:monocarboxylate transporter 12-like isoform X2 [Mytilus californianus]|uniref:monocarboxylate transporter 12-like isoform X2 n=1 Tax=Mytilus californianus TaxID=6549 RepID=UPI002247239F|nr:monocarboxylate transporter 12-like isoform X2 [Mytilus californianus]
MQKFNIYPSPQWLIVLCGFVCCILGTSIPDISGIIHLELLENFYITDVQAAWAGSIFNSMFMISGPIGSLLTNTFSCRVCIITGSVVGLVGFGLTSLTENIYIMYVTYGLIAGTSQSLIYTGVLISVGYYFDKGRSIATGVVVNGCGVAMLALPPIMHQCVSSFGIHGAFLLIGAAFFQCAVFGALMRPNSVEMNSRKEKKTKNTEELYDNQCVRLGNSIRNSLSELGTVEFFLFCISSFCWNVSFNISILYFPKYFKTNGVSKYDVSYLISATGIGNICGRYLVGLAASDREIGSRLLYFGQFSLIGIFTLFLPFYKNYAIQFLYMTAFGMYTGGVWILQTVIVVELVSLSNLASGFGIVMFCGGLGQLAVPLIAGSLYILSAILCALTARKPSSKCSSVTNVMLDDENKTHNDIELIGELEMELFIDKR